MQISVNKVEKKCGPLIVYWHFFYLNGINISKITTKSTGRTVSCKIVSQLDIFTILTLNSVTGCSDV